MTVYRGDDAMTQGGEYEIRRDIDRLVKGHGDFAVTAVTEHLDAD